MRSLWCARCVFLLTEKRRLAWRRGTEGAHTGGFVVNLLWKECEEKPGEPSFGRPGDSPQAQRGEAWGWS